MERRDVDISFADCLGVESPGRVLVELRVFLVEPHGNFSIFVALNDFLKL